MKLIHLGTTAMSKMASFVILYFQYFTRHIHYHKAEWDTMTTVMANKALNTTAMPKKVTVIVTFKCLNLEQLLKRVMCSGQWKY